MSTWPSSLPALNLPEFSIQPDVAFARTDMEGGPARQRRRYTSPSGKFNAAWVFTAAQMSTFKTFYESTINSGTDWFTLNINAGAGAADKDCRFIESYTATYLGNAWHVAAKMEVRGA